MRSSPNGQIPLELWRAILSDFDLIELLRCAAVCRTWRDAAKDLPQYWRDIALVLRKIRSPETILANGRAVDLFYTRINHRSATGLRLRIEGKEDAPLHYVCTILSGHLGRVANLTIQSWPVRESNALLEALRRPAPLLDELFLWFDDGRMREVPEQTIPMDIFAARPAALRRLSLINATLPAAPPPAFAQLTHISYEDNNLPDVSRALMLSEKVQDFTLYDTGDVTAFRVQPDRSVVQRAAQLNSLTIASFEETIEERLLEWLPMPHMDAIWLSFGSFDGSRAMCEIATHVAGPLAVVIAREDDDSLQIVLRGARVRRFSAYWDTFVDAQMPAVMRAVADRITTLRVCADQNRAMWAGLCRVQELPALEELMLCLDEQEIVYDVVSHDSEDDAWPWSDYENSMACPRLRRLCIHFSAWGDAIQMVAADISDLITALRGAAPLELVLLGHAAAVISCTAADFGNRVVKITRCRTFTCSHAIDLEFNVPTDDGYEDPDAGLGGE